MRPPNYDSGKTWHLHDDIYFGDSKNSIGIQLADLCGFVIRRHLEGDLAVAGFYDIMSNQIAFHFIEPKE